MFVVFVAFFSAAYHFSQLFIEPIVCDIYFFLWYTKPIVCVVCELSLILVQGKSLLALPVLYQYFFFFLIHSSCVLTVTKILQS